MGMRAVGHETSCQEIVETDDQMASKFATVV